MSRWRPTLTPEQYRQQSMQLRVEVSEIAWSLVKSPVLAGAERTWRPLTEAESLDVFDRLMAAVTRHSGTDRAHVEGERSKARR